MRFIKTTWAGAIGSTADSGTGESTVSAGAAGAFVSPVSHAGSAHAPSPHSSCADAAAAQAANRTASRAVRLVFISGRPVAADRPPLFPITNGAARLLCGARKFEAVRAASRGAAASALGRSPLRGSASCSFGNQCTNLCPVVPRSCCRPTVFRAAAPSGRRKRTTRGGAKRPLARSVACGGRGTRGRLPVP